jgi:hypothetical protein
MNKDDRVRLQHILTRHEKLPPLIADLAALLLSANTDADDTNDTQDP